MVVGEAEGGEVIVHMGREALYGTTKARTKGEIPGNGELWCLIPVR